VSSIPVSVPIVWIAFGIVTLIQTLLLPAAKFSLPTWAHSLLPPPMRLSGWAYRAVRLAVSALLIAGGATLLAFRA
jgi:hypothetical protein